MAFTLPDLPYAHDALAGLGMSAETLEFHHDLHHKAYVDNGNKLIAGTEWEGKSLEDIVRGTYNASKPCSSKCLAATGPACAALLVVCFLAQAETKSAPRLLGLPLALVMLWFFLFVY